MFDNDKTEAENYFFFKKSILYIKKNSFVFYLVFPINFEVIPSN